MNLSHPAFVAATQVFACLEHRWFHPAHQFIDDAVAALDGIRSVCRIAQGEREQLELVFQLFHVRVVLFCLVEDEVAFPVERFQVGLYARGFVGLFLLVTPDVERNLVLFADFGYQRFENLLENGSCSLLFSM